VTGLVQVPLQDASMRSVQERGVMTGDICGAAMTTRWPGVREMAAISGGTGRKVGAFAMH
ncbi:MAG: hypothetical protein OXC91_07105, partial [Rhodobacteraceae bacterium]|nr:hypothetical protein [Paracoccaceae bacterium]